MAEKNGTKQIAPGRDTLLHYFRQFTSIFATIVLIVAIAVFTGKYTDEKELADEMVINSLEMYVDQQEISEYELVRIASAIWQNVALDIVGDEVDGYDAKEFSRLLRNFRTANTNIFDIVLFYAPPAVSGGDMTVLTCNSCMDEQTFWNYYYPFEDLSYDDLIDLRTGPDSARFLYSQQVRTKTGSDSYILYIAEDPVAPKPDQGRGMLMIMIDMDSFLDYARMSVPQDSSLRVYDRSGNMLYSLGTAENAQSAAELIAAEPETPFKTVFADGASGYIERSDSGLYYIIECKAGEGTILSSLHYIAPLVGLLLIFCPLLALYLSRIAVKPISAIGGRLGMTDREAYSINSILESIDSIRLESENMAKQIDNTTQLSRVQLLSALVNSGSGAANEDFAEMMRRTGWRTHDTNWFVMLVLIPEAHMQKTYVRQALYDMMQRSLTGALPYLVYQESNRRTYVIAQTGGRDYEQALEETAADLLARLTRYVPEPSFAAGEPVSSLQGVSLSAAQARQAAEMAYVSGTGRILRYQAPLKEDAVKKGLLKLLSRAVSSVRNSSREETNASLDALYDALRSCQPTLEVVQFILMELIAEVLTICEEMSVTPDNKAVSMSIHDIYDEGSSLDRFEGSMSLLTDSIFAALDQKNSMKNADLAVQISEYIDENYADPNLDVTRVAGHFGFSDGYLSKLCKRHSGATIAQLIDSRRMRAAEELIRATDLTLDDIIAGSGYIDKNNFIRKFKKQYGATPMQFRERQRHYEESK